MAAQQKYLYQYAYLDGSSFKADDLGERLSKVATLEELVNILTSLLNG